MDKVTLSTNESSAKKRNSENNQANNSTTPTTQNQFIGNINKHILSSEATTEPHRTFISSMIT